MTATIAKIGSAAAAFSYYSERDDYYLSDHVAAGWYGAGAARLGLAGEINPHDFHDVLAGRFGGAQVGKSDRHTPGWDFTFSAPKSVSVAALVNKDERLTGAHDAAVRAALDYLQTHTIVTRQRAADGGYSWTPTAEMIAGVVRHSTSRNSDPQLHSHAVIANMTRDPATGRWVSIDSRAGLYRAQIEANNVYMNALAAGARRAGYTVDWMVLSNNAASFELREIDPAERDVFSTRRHEIEARLIAKGIDPSSASREARQAATLDTRSPKQHAPGSELHARWAEQASTAGYNTDTKPKRINQPGPDKRTAAPRAAIASGIAQIAERQTRFTARQVIAAATTFARGEATQVELAAALREAHDRGDLLDRAVQIRGYSKELERVSGYTTNEAVETERDMLFRADSLVGRAAALSVSSGAISEQIAERELMTGHAFTPEQRAATESILAGGAGLYIVQGHAGTAKTTSVLATVADAAKRSNIRIRAIAPTHSAVDALASAVGGDGRTVAAINHQQLECDGRHELWIVDEAGMVSARDMKALLAKADQARAEVILTGDTKQIGSVGAGSAFQQIQDRHPARLSRLTDIKRQTSSQLKAAVYDSIAGRFGDALNKVDTREVKQRSAALGAIADRYIEQTERRKSTVVVTLSRADRSEVNAEIQRRREAAGQVRHARGVVTLQPRQWTDAEQKDASRYRVGDTVEAIRDFKRGPKRGELATVEDVKDGKITARTPTGKQWTFDPERTKAIAVLDKSEGRFGMGDKIVAKGAIRATDADNTEVRVEIKNGTQMTVEDASGDALKVQLHDGRHAVIDTRRGVKADLAYAKTGDQAQGQTVDSVIAYMRSGQTNLADRQHAYVALSRARESATVVTDDKAKLAQALEKSAARRDAAAEPVHAACEGSHPAARSLTQRAAAIAADILAGIENRVTAVRAAQRARDDEKWAKQDREWLRRGDRVRTKVELGAAREELSIAQRFGTKPDRGALGRTLETSRQAQGRQLIDQLRTRGDSALAKLDDSLSAAFTRSVQRESKQSGASAAQAQRRVAERTLIDRNFRFEAAVLKVAAWFAEGAQPSQKRGGGGADKEAAEDHKHARDVAGASDAALSATPTTTMPEGPAGETSAHEVTPGSHHHDIDIR